MHRIRGTILNANNENYVNERAVIEPLENEISDGVNDYIPRQLEAKFRYLRVSEYLLF